MSPLLIDQSFEDWPLDGVPKYRREQLRRWIFEQGCFAWEEMTNLPKSLREELSKNGRFYLWN